MLGTLRSILCFAEDTELSHRILDAQVEDSGGQGCSDAEERPPLRLEDQKNPVMSSVHHLQVSNAPKRNDSVKTLKVIDVLDKVAALHS